MCIHRVFSLTQFRVVSQFSFHILPFCKAKPNKIVFHGWCDLSYFGFKLIYIGWKRSCYLNQCHLLCTQDQESENVLKLCKEVLKAFYKLPATAFLSTGCYT